MNEPVTLLIDADVVAFTAASAVQHIHTDSFGFIMPFANTFEGEAVVDNMVVGLELAFKATHLRFILSDPIVSTVIPGMRKVRHVERNAAASDGEPLSQATKDALRRHRWDRTHVIP